VNARIALLCTMVVLTSAAAQPVEHLERAAAEVARAGEEIVDQARDAVAEALRPPPRLAPEPGVYLLTDPDAGGDESGWTPLREGEPPARLVLLVHGLDDPGDIWDQLAPALATRGHTVAKLEYPNDQAIARSAAQMLGGLERLRARGVTRIDIVAHSMGGLVARDALTRPRADEAPPLLAVGRLIMVGTPNHGSAFASMRGVAEARERLSRWLDSPDWDLRPLFEADDDGAGEAGRDLEPGSPFLTELNARPNPEGVELTVIAGVVGLLEEDDLAGLRRNELVRTLLSREQAEGVTATLERWERRLGDGVVPLDSAVLDGVGDVEVLDATHRGLLRTLESEQAVRSVTPEGRQPEPPAIPLILERLQPHKAEKDS